MKEKTEDLVLGLSNFPPSLRDALDDCPGAQEDLDAAPDATAASRVWRRGKQRLPTRRDLGLPVAHCGRYHLWCLKVLPEP